jgi:hypothetical protein
MDKAFNMYQDCLKQIEISKVIERQAKLLLHEKGIIDRLLNKDPHNERLHEKQIENAEKIHALQIFSENEINKMKKKMKESGQVVDGDFMALEDDVKKNIDGKSIKEVFKYINGLDEKN